MYMFARSIVLPVALITLLGAPDAQAMPTDKSLSAMVPIVSELREKINDLSPLEPVVIPEDAVFAMETGTISVIPAPPPPPPPPVPEPEPEPAAAPEKKVQETQEKTDTSVKQRGSKVASGESQAIAHRLVLERGWGEEGFSCLVSLWEKESNWNHTAENPSSGAYGIPQSLPGSKMASAGSDWQTNPETQIRWGLGYINDRYGSPCEAWAHSEAKNWY